MGCTDPIEDNQRWERENSEIKKSYSGKEVIYHDVADITMGTILTYLENSKKIDRKIEGEKGEVYFLEEGKIRYDFDKKNVTLEGLDKKTEKHLEKLIEVHN